MKAKVSWSGMRYQLQDEFMPLDYGGVSSIVDGGLSYPVIRSRKTTVTTGVTVADKRLSDKRSGVNQDERHVSSGTISLDGVNFDELMGGGSMSWHTSMSSGDFHESNNFAHQDAVLNGSEGPFTYFSTSVDRLQRLSEKLSLNLSWSGQFANGNLSSGEKFYLGGPSGVRAYPVGEAGGDEGHLLNATVEVSGFYDAGRITLNHDRYTEDVVSATGRNTYWLQGAGIGLNWVYASTVVVHTTWAHTIGSNPGRSIYGMNADGRRDNSRFWLQAMLYF
jgi:hemolysin activation/secretion protein